MSNDWTELTVIEPDVAIEICAERCGSKCCNFVTSDHYVPIEMVDYANLARLGLHKFVTFFSSVDRPQLINTPTGDCVFLKENRLCSIYEFRPMACRKYPFRESKDDVADLPDWCELHHRASEELRIERIQAAQKMNDDYDKLQKHIDYDVLMDYLQKDKGTKVYQLPDFFDERRIEQSDQFWMLSAITSEYLDELEGKLNKIRDDFTNEWMIIKLVVYDDELNIIGTIEGVMRQAETVEIPYFTDFPPTNREYETLLNMITSTDSFNEHLYGGAYLTDTFYEYIEMQVKKTEPLNSEFL